MKFDYIIGNPPFNENLEGTSDNPIYDSFMDEAYKIGKKVELITPARFLFDAGKTKPKWNKKMLKDEHLKVLYYEPIASNVFSNVNFKGGVAITLRNSTKKLGPIEVFSSYPLLNDIRIKVEKKINRSLSDIVYAPESYKFTEELYYDHPQIKTMTYIKKGEEMPLISKGHDFDLTTNIFEKLGNIVFFEKKPIDNEKYIQIVGRLNNKRKRMWINIKYIRSHDNLDCYKMILPKSNGTGKFGERLSTPLLGEPSVGHTQTFISIGKFSNIEEATALIKYIKTKFCRAMLGVLKATQDNKQSVWKYVPFQDFTSSSDINWSKSIHEIDLQLYAKYELTYKEINFIETEVEAME